MADEEGWYTDPYGLHEARWFSQGQPTRLVRDGDVESSDEPPAEAPSGEPVELHVTPSSTGDTDLRRADDAEREPDYDPQAAGRAAFDALDRSVS